jgi:male-specific lethal 1
MLKSAYVIYEWSLSANAGNDDRRVQQLRQLLLSQLDLIQKQADVIVAKDQQIKDIRNENETLKIKVAAYLSPPPAKTNSTLVSGEKSKKPKGVVIKEESIEEIEEPEEDTPDDEDFFEQMETEEPYFTLQNEIVVHKVDEDHDLKVDEKKAEVLPGWRLKPISPSYIMEGTENIEDETILKRHQKPETDEKRRKRLKIRAFIISRLLILM